jgi:hypothetical protein
MLEEVPLSQTELDSDIFSFLTDEENMATYHSQVGRGAKIPKPLSKSYKLDCRAFMPALLSTNINRAQATKSMTKMSAEERKNLRDDNTSSFSMCHVLAHGDVHHQVATVKLYCSFLHLYILYHL